MNWMCVFVFVKCYIFILDFGFPRNINQNVYRPQSHLEPTTECEPPIHSNRWRIMFSRWRGVCISFWWISNQSVVVLLLNSIEIFHIKNLCGLRLSGKQFLNWFLYRPEQFKTKKHKERKKRQRKKQSDLKVRGVVRLFTS